MTRLCTLIAGLTLGLVLLTVAAPASAAPDVAPCKDGATIVPMTGAPLYRVESGLFQIQENQVVDLTDRKVTFRFKGNRRRKANRIQVFLNGTTKHVLSPGQRLDLRKQLKDTFADRKACFIDWIKSANPRGAPAVAIFRLHCV